MLLEVSEVTVVINQDLSKGSQLDPLLSLTEEHIAIALIVGFYAMNNTLSIIRGDIYGFGHLVLIG